VRSARGRRRPVQPVVGALADGTPFYAPIGEIVTDGPLVTCHLCGRLLRSVAAHLAAHGWTKQQYCQAFGLERRASLEGTETRKLRAAALTARLIFDPAIREGSAAGRERARDGRLARDAAAAARGRRFPEQRRRKAARAAAGVPADVLARASRERADRHLAGVAAATAWQQGYRDIGAYVRGRLAAGDSLAAMSRSAGLHKDWLSRHLARLDPAAATAARAARAGLPADGLPAGGEYPGRRAAGQPDAALLRALSELGFSDVAAYLRDRHHGRHWTVNAIAAETGASHHAVAAALRRHGVAPVPHAARRHAAAQREAAVAAQLGCDSVSAYVAQRRSAGFTWRAMSAETGQSQTWLRRRAAS
jgi:hypothetical protein